jgi:hypothetical protein
MNRQDIPIEDTFDRILAHLGGGAQIPPGHSLDKPFNTDAEAVALVSYIIRDIFLDSGLSDDVLNEHLRKSYRRLAHVLRLKTFDPNKYRAMVNVMSTNWTDWKDAAQ